MFKSIKVTEDVYLFLKARANEKKKSLSDVIRDLYSTKSVNQTTEKRFSDLESELNTILTRLDNLESLNELKPKNKRPSRDLNPSRSLDRAP